MIMKHKAYRAIISFIVLSTLLISCENGYDCSLENTAYNRVGIYSTGENGIEAPYAFPEALTVSLMVNGKDSIVINHIEDAQLLQIPMSYTNECDTVIFHYEGNFTDTLYMEHLNIPYYISMECGTVMYHKLTGLRHTNSLIDSAAILNDYINFDYNENIKIYLID